MIGGAEAVFAADVELTPSIREKAWSRPPIQVRVPGKWGNRCSCLPFAQVYRMPRLLPGALAPRGVVFSGVWYHYFV